MKTTLYKHLSVFFSVILISSSIYSQVVIQNFNNTTWSFVAKGNIFENVDTLKLLKIQNIRNRDDMRIERLAEFYELNDYGIIKFINRRKFKLEFYDVMEGDVSRIIMNFNWQFDKGLCCLKIWTSENKAACFIIVSTSQFEINSKYAYALPFRSIELTLLKIKDKDK